MFTEQSLSNTLGLLGLPTDPTLFEKLRAAHSQPTRHYHDASHVAECLRHFSLYRHLADHPGEIEIAIWFHDAVYDTHEQDNEEQSAAWAERYLSTNSADPATITRVSEMILATKTHHFDSADSALLLDIDLGILGTSPQVFEQYDLAIRAEYHWVPEETYREARVQVLRSFLGRERIYQTQTIRDRLEKQARQNLALKIDMLESA